MPSRKTESTHACKSCGEPLNDRKRTYHPGCADEAIRKTKAAYRARNRTKRNAQAVRRYHRTKGNVGTPGRPKIFKQPTRTGALIDRDDFTYLFGIGDGNLSAGVREAVRRLKAKGPVKSRKDRDLDLDARAERRFNRTKDGEGKIGRPKSLKGCSAKSMSIDGADLEYLSDLGGDNFSAGVREAVRLLRATDKKKKQA